MSQLDFKLYAKTAQHQRNCEDFLSVIVDYPYLKFFRPNSEASPWHVVCRLACPDGEDIYLNFWPHLLKAYRNNGKTVVGVKAIDNLIAAAVRDQYPDG